MKKLIIALAALCFLVGCGASMKFVTPAPIKLQPDYMIGEVQKKTVGEPMLTVSSINGSYYPAFKAKSSYNPPTAFSVTFPEIRQNMVLVCKQKTEDENLFCEEIPLGLRAFQYGGYSWPYCVIIKPSGEAIGDGRCFGMSYSRIWAETQSIFEPIQIPQGSSKSLTLDFLKTITHSTKFFTRELIYNGKTKDSIKIAYREFIDDMARPAFSQDLSYDLSESKTIGFRGMQIEVIEATNSYITFKVKSKME